MNEGTGVYAIREGLVVDVKEDSNVGCPSDECLKMANYITVLHDDHSFAEYAHLKKNGALVKAGDKIKRGDLIGYSGKTGWATGAHLHVEVYTRNRGDRKTSVSTYYKAGGKKTILKKGDRPVNQ
ncbi:M23 family metallopeptidase [Abyssalbus ytuae]|uniref:M23 family metallopeptidase n=2 Tax=Abyssalbus ytuae TaxID=2926907 RepID=A0A9E7A1U7_9FLAO|nr:M23 family metallopeptidase [Abyssalbus ytuae]